MPFILSFIAFYLFLLCFKGRAEGHCPGLVTRGDNVTHKLFMEMRRLACDETPFLLVMPPKPLPWFGDQIDGSVIPLHVHGHNRPTRDETSHPPTKTLSFYLSYGFPFLTEKPFIAFSGIPGRSISRVSFWLFNLANYFYPLGL
jgi:hypothetical protein